MTYNQYEGKKKIELLAPAGSLQALKAAVENGADAVYIGGPMFSARQKAENFTHEQMVAGVQYAHERGCKVHVAVNTIVSNEEIGQVVEYAYKLAEAKVDAVIVQDLGVAHLLRETLPQLPLHASTQMAVHNTPGVQFLEEQGFERVVLARETSLEAIREIKAETDAELEVFVHGALCVAYSGQCLLSSMIGGRSGNRGLCAQPCRMQYQLVDEGGREYQSKDGQYLLSTRDLNMIHHLPDLIRAGVTSLKIEGRMKRPEYVATVVRQYRQAIDAYYAGSQFDKKLADKNLLQIFNRDFTTGYFYGNQGADLMSHVRPDNRGVLIADVMKVENKKVWVQLHDTLSVGDGYLLYNQRGEEIAGKVQEMSIKGKAIQSGNKGQIVQMTVSGNAAGAKQMYRTSDVVLLKAATDSFSRPSQPQKEKVHFKLELSLGKPMMLYAWDDNGNQYYAESEYIVELAKNRPSDLESVKKQMDRLGNTLYELGEFTAEIEDGIIAPASELNNLRRAAIEGLEAQKQESAGETVELESYADYLDNAGDLLDRIPPQVLEYGLKQKLAVTVGSVEAMQAAVENGAEYVYLNTTALRKEKAIVPEQYAALAKWCHSRNAKLYWTSSPIENDTQMKKAAANMWAAKDAGFDGVAVGNLGLLQTAKEQGWDTIVADYQMNIFNDVTLQFLSRQEISRAVLSPELSLEQIAEFSYLGNLPLELIVHGNLPLMVSEQCVCGSVLGGRTAQKQCSMPCMKEQYALKDRTGAQFPLYMDEHCRMHVFNSKTLNLYKRLEEALKTGADVLRIEGRERSAEWIGTVTAIYKKAIDTYNQTGSLITDITAMQSLEGLAPEGSTYGHYFRGVL
jgi:putative protease